MPQIFIEIEDQVERKGSGMRGDDEMNRCGNRDGCSGKMRKLGEQKKGRQRSEQGR